MPIAVNEPAQPDAVARGNGRPANAVFSIDVEDWFHILELPDAPQLWQWGSLPSRVEMNFMRLLDLLSASHATATCFFLGWVAKRLPHLVREAAGRGHEIASHGNAHRLAGELGRDDFRKDALDSRLLLEDISAAPVLGYRSAGFSATRETPWFFEALVEAGYRYDSSLFPAARAHGGMVAAERAPHVVQTPAGALFEFPITVANVGGWPLCFFGGGYLRLFPYPLIRRMAYRVLAEGRPIVFYVHPREVDPNHPRLPMTLLRRFKSYYNLGSTEPKLRHILQDFKVCSFYSFARQQVRIGNSANEGCWEVCQDWPEIVNSARVPA